MIYLVVSKEEVRLLQMAKKITSDILPVIDDFNYISFNGFETLIQDVVGELQSTSFSEGHKVVVLDHAYFLASNPDKCSLDKDQNFDSLLEYLKAPEPDTDFIILVEGELGASKDKLIAALKKLAKKIEVPELSLGQWVGAAQARAKERKATIGSNVVEELLKRVKNDTSTFINYLDLLLTYSKNVTMNDLDLLVTKPLEDNVFKVIEYLNSGYLNKALKQYRDLLNLGYESLQLLPIFTSQFKFLFQVAYALNLLGNEDKISEFLKANPYRVRYSLYAARSIGMEGLVKIMDSLGQLEKRIKLKNLNGNFEMELWLSEFGINFLRR